MVFCYGNQAYFDRNLPYCHHGGFLHNDYLDHTDRHCHSSVGHLLGVRYVQVHVYHNLHLDVLPSYLGSHVLVEYYPCDPFKTGSNENTYIWKLKPSAHLLHRGIPQKGKFHSSTLKLLTVEIIITIQASPGIIKLYKSLTAGKCK